MFELILGIDKSDWFIIASFSFLFGDFGFKIFCKKLKLNQTCTEYFDLIECDHTVDGAIDVAKYIVQEIKTNIKSEFISQGINQTLHRLYLQIDCEISILTPFNTINESISNQLILAENIIVGEIPETYYNLEGMTEGDVMEVMQ